jgi:subtilisin family serine protease
MINKKLLFSLPIFFLLFLPGLGASIADTIEPVIISPTEKSSFNPVVRPAFSMDTNDNKIHDHLEKLIQTGAKGGSYTTIVTFDRPVTQSVIDGIKQVGGEVMSTWDLIYGASVRIRTEHINDLSSVPGVTLVTENYRMKKMLSTSVPQINVRPYVWDTLGYEGASGQAIAILDGGVDDSHSDLSGRVVAWQDFIGHDADSSGDEYATATDWDGHGTHCASIAAGSGAAGGTSNYIDISDTMGFTGLSAGQGYVSNVEVETSGTVQIEAQWSEKPGPDAPDDTLFIAFDNDQSGSFGGSDQIVSGDHSAEPITLTTSTLSPGKYLFLIGPWDDGEINSATVQYTIRRPASSTSDGNNKYRGVAPGCDIVGVKVLDDTGAGYTDDLLDGLSWVNSNAATYGINVVSMSLGFTSVVSSIDTAVNNLVSNGIVCVAAAGNGFLDDQAVGSPGTATKAITVGSINDVDKVAIYSSNGASDSKPDVVAPGGSWNYITGENSHPIVAADSNDRDEAVISGVIDDYYWEPEMNLNDYFPSQGTSMACPHVAGLAALIIDAMAGNWSRTEANALKVKNYICGTASEVRFGESYDIYENDPDSDRGDRDQTEGYGKVHADAAIEAFLREYINGSEVSDTLGNSPSDKQVWARQVELKNSIIFTAGIELPGTADFDLYLYDPTEDMSSTNGILASSVNPGSGMPENLVYTPGSDMTAYLVVKRVSGHGTFDLSSEATATGTPPPSGFTWPWGVPIFVWAMLGTVGLTAILFLSRRRK